MMVIGVPSKAGNLALSTARATHVPVLVRMCDPIAAALLTCPLGVTTNLIVTLPANFSTSWAAIDVAAD